MNFAKKLFSNFRELSHKYSIFSFAERTKIYFLFEHISVLIVQSLLQSYLDTGVEHIFSEPSELELVRLKG